MSSERLRALFLLSLPLVRCMARRVVSRDEGLVTLGFGAERATTRRSGLGDEGRECATRWPPRSPPPPLRCTWSFLPLRSPPSLRLSFLAAIRSPPVRASEIAATSAAVSGRGKYFMIQFGWVFVPN